MTARPSHLILSVIEGEAREKSLGLEWGQHRRPFSVGKEGDWVVHAPGVADVHLFLAFRGSRLCVAPASAQTRVRAGGVRLPETWSELPLPAEIRFGQARLRARAALSSLDTLATTREVDLKKLAPLLDASRPCAARPPAALLETALAAPPAALLETMCDGGALHREAKRLLAEARAGAIAPPSVAASPALQAPDPSAFALEPAAAVLPPAAAVARQLASSLRPLSDLLARCRSQGSRRWQQLRSLRVPPSLAADTTSPRFRRSAIAALALVLLAVLAGRLLAPAGAAAPLAARTPTEPEGTGVAAAELAAAEPPALGAEAGGVPAHQPGQPPAPSSVASLEAVSPSPRLQREAFRAAFGGDSAGAAALYQQLSSGPDERVYQLAARYAAQGRVRKP